MIALADLYVMDSVSNGSGFPGCGPAFEPDQMVQSGLLPRNRGTHRVRGWVGTGPWFHIMVPATLAPIKYLGSDRVTT